MACSSEATINLNFIFHEALALVREMESIEGIACALNEHLVGHQSISIRPLNLLSLNMNHDTNP